VYERDASACGGCFQPGENPTVVTDHRMLFSISQDQSTLYDQIKYSGAPTEFGWVLPIAGTVDVGLSADTVFGAFDRSTQTRILPPPLNCPLPPSGCAFGGANAAPPNPPAAPPPAGGVDVISEKVVGPYETVQLASTDANALTNWLASHGYVVDASVKPVIDAYVSEKFNFLAMKLVPGTGVQSMRPVRVTSKGSSLALPLRMISAGTGATVGISLWVIADGRYQPQNFPFFHIETDEIVWDWTQNKSNYTQLRADKEAALGAGKTWEIESSIPISASQIRAQAGTGEPYYDPMKDGDGGIIETASQVEDDDFAAMFHGITSPRVTRMRADIAHAQLLTGDLVLTASPDQAELTLTRSLTKELNEPQCPVYQGCQVVGTAPRSEAAARAGNGNDSSTSTCAMSPSRSSGWLLAGIGFIAFVFAKIRRRLLSER
jgi:hypothetical protein